MDKELLKQLGSVKKYNAHDFICYEGEQGVEMYIILNGKVEVYLNSFDTYPLKVSEMKAGDFFGEMSILEGLPRSATIIAAQDTIVLAISKENFEQFISKQPGMAYRIMRALSGRVRKMNADLTKSKESSQDDEASDDSGGQASGAEKGSGLEAAASAQDKQSAGVSQAVAGKLFPEGHKSFKSAAPAAHKEFIFDKQVKCPICDKSFNAKMQRLSKLKPDKLENDFRQKYVDFEPLWYNIWVCPNCYFANFYFEFDAISDKGIKPVREALAELKGTGLTFNYTDPRQIDQVFTAYYIAVMCAERYKAVPLKFAKLWMQISWLYKDMGDEEMFKCSALNAHENYFNAMYHSKLNISTETEQQLYLIMGELFLIKGDMKEATKHFYSAIKRSGGRPQFNQQAQDRLEELKKMQKAEA